MTVTQIAVKRPTLVVVIFSVLGLLGIYCYSLLNYELFPKMDMPMVIVMTIYPGASVYEVENGVTRRIEDALSSLENTKNIRSISRESLSLTIIELEQSANIDFSAQDAQRKVNAIIYRLPEECRTPALMTFSMDEMPVLKLGLIADIADTKLYSLVDNIITSRLSKVEGVGQVTVVGGSRRQINVNIDKEKLRSYKISIAMVYGVLANSNMDFPTGKIEGNTSEYTIRISGKITSLETLREIVLVRAPNGSIVKLSDVAEIEDGIAKQSSLTRINGANSIGLIIQKQSDANAVAVSKLVRSEIALLESEYSDMNLKFDVAADVSLFTLASANAVLFDLSMAIILVAIVMFFFLHSFRNSFIVLVSIPTSIVSVFALMYVFGFSLNMMSLMALSLVIGILVDDSIVVLENIHRHLEMKKDKVTAALDGRSEIGFTAVSITLVDVVVFLPLALVSGMVGNMLREFALVIVVSTLMSLFVSFTITPLLASRLGKLERVSNSLIGRFAISFENNFKKLLYYYEKTLRWVLNHKKWLILTVTILIFSSFLLIGFGFIGTEFFSMGDRGEFVIQLEGEAQNSLQQTNRLIEGVEKMLSSKPEVTKIFSTVGGSSNPMQSSSGQHKSEITVSLANKKDRTITVEDYAKNVKDEISKIPGIKVRTAPTSFLGSADQAPIQILVTGNNLDTIYQAANDIMDIMTTVPGTSDYFLSIEKSKPEMQVTLDRDKMSMLGFSIADVGTTLNLAFAGNADLIYSEGSEDFYINIQYDKFDRKSIDDVSSLTFLNNQGQLVELKDFADISQSLGPTQLERYNRISSITANCFVIGRPVGTVGQEIKDKIIKTLHTSRDVTVHYKGQLEFQSDAFSSLFTAILFALIFIYAIMVALYNSYLHPFIVLFSIPVAIIGALLALALSGENLSVFSLVGIIMLLGLVCKNAILIVDFTNHIRETGTSVIEALVTSGKERLRPILMTTFSMVFGLLPIALASGDGSEMKNGLAWVIIGGLLSSLFLTIFLVPSVYMIAEDLKERLKAKIGKSKTANVTTVE
jgi:HAE1 family hydrophobic/amphiphilic exporter-1